ncbi:MAG: hypothetical protein AAB866_00790 [Patescibacteria group bacterium]
MKKIYQIGVVMALLMLWTSSALAHRSPDGCSGSGLGINLSTNSPQVHIGDVISYSLDVFNGTGIGPIVCDATDIQASLVTPDGQNHSISLTRTSLSNGQIDSYSNIVTYTAQAQDVKNDGTLTATASDTGIIHQNDTDSSGGGNQGVNVTVLSTLPPIFFFPITVPPPTIPNPPVVIPPIVAPPVIVPPAVISPSVVVSTPLVIPPVLESRSGSTHRTIYVPITTTTTTIITNTIIPLPNFPTTGRTVDVYGIINSILIVILIICLGRLYFV